jgi:hypothetical protein
MGLQFYRDSLTLKEKLGDELGIAEVKACIGGMYLDQGLKKEAVETCEESFKILKRIESPLSAKVSKWIAEAKENE